MRAIVLRSALTPCLAAAGLFTACATPPAPKPLAPSLAPACADFSFPIYFESGSDDLTQAARVVLVDASVSARRCAISRVEVLGLADADGPTHRNLVLSRRRAGVVAKALMEAGLPGPDFDIEAIGEAGARAADGKADPMRRRTEVVIHMTAPKPR